MDETDLEHSRLQKQKLTEMEIDQVSELPFNLVGRRSNKTVQLLANSGVDQPMKGTNSWFEYEFIEPVFLTQVEVQMEGYGRIDRFEFAWTDVQGEEETKQLARESEGVVYCQINRMVRRVGFRPPAKLVKKPQIDSVSLYGFDKGELNAFLEMVDDIDDYRSSIVKETAAAIEGAERANEKVRQLRVEQHNLNADSESKNKEITSLNNEIGKLTEQRNSLLADIKSREETANSLEDKEAALNSELEILRSNRTALNGEISEKSRELKSLEDDINMFPTDLKGFSEQATKNIEFYWKLSAVPIVILVIMVVLLVINAANLTTVLDENENARIFSILATRLPYVIVVSAIIGATFKLSAILISEIVRINQQMLNLSKISVIATDVSMVSEEGIEALSDEEKLEYKVRLKMEMLRDHLKGYLSNDFEPQLSSRKNRTASDLTSTPEEDDDEY